MDRNVYYDKVVRVEVTIRRPNGDIEIVDVSNKYHRLNDVAFAHIQKATKDAGRGDVLGYKNITETAFAYKKTDADLMDDSYEAQIEMMTMGEE